MDKFGTKEWTDRNYNLFSGCENNCKYCYAKEMALRFKRKTTDDWTMPVRNKKCLTTGKVNGRTMFPSTHDITPDTIEDSIKYLRNMFEQGNEILIVTKPRLEMIQRLCDEFYMYSHLILFRFTIGSVDNDTLKFWEPDAPSFEERMQSLRHAFNHGFHTSVSCEPILDGRPDLVINTIKDYVTEHIWVGRPNFLIRRLKINQEYDSIERANNLMSILTEEFIQDLKTTFRDNSKVVFMNDKLG